MLDADAPGAAARHRTDAAHIATEIDKAVARAALGEDGGGAIGRVFLADAAEVDLHLRARQVQVRPLPLHLVPANKRQQRREFRGRRHALRAKVPGPAQDARSEIEAAAALRMQAVAEIEQRRGFLVDCYCFGAGAAIDFGGHAVAAIA